MTWLRMWGPWALAAEWPQMGLESVAGPVAPGELRMSHLPPFGQGRQSLEKGT